MYNNNVNNLDENRCQRKRGQKLHEEKMVQRNRIFVSINNHKVMGLIDSGADVSLIREDLARTMRLKWRREPRDFDSFCTANEGLMENLGTTICDIRVGGLSLGAKLNVVTGLTNTLILGIDFLKDHGKHIIIPEGIVEFYDYTVQVPVVQGNPKRALKRKQFVRCIEKVTIPPKTEQIIWTRPGKEYQAIGSVLIEHSGSMDDFGLQTVRCLVKDDKDMILCKVFNYTGNVVELQPGTKIGIIEQEIIAPGVSTIKAKTEMNQWTTQVRKFIAGVEQKSAQEIVDDMGIKLDRSRMTDEEYRL